MIDQRKLAHDAQTRFHDDPLFHATVVAVAGALIGNGPLFRPARELVCLVIHARDVLAEHCRNPLMATEQLEELAQIPQLTEEQKTKIMAEFGLS